MDSPVLSRKHVFSAALFAMALAMPCAALAFSATSVGNPMNGQGSVPVWPIIDREFDAAVDQGTVSVGADGTVRLQAHLPNTQEGTATGANLCSSAHLMNSTRVVCEHGQLTAGAWYTLTFTTGLQSDAAAALASDVTYTFQTSSFEGGDMFISPPFIIGSVPRSGATFPSNAKIRVYFEPGGSGSGSTMKTSETGSVMSPTNVQLYAAANGQPTNDTNLLACATVGGNAAAPTDCNMAWLSASRELVITPGKKAPAGSQDSTGGTTLAAGSYVLVVKGPTGGGGQGPSAVGGVRNTDNVPLGGADYYVSFTATGADIVAPRVRATFPQENATGVDRATYNIAIGFTEAIDAATITTSTVKLYSDEGDTAFDADTDTLIVDTIVEYFPDRDEAVLSPTVLLTAGTKHFVVLTTSVKDIAGNAFAAQKVIPFTTGTLVNGAAAPDTAKPKIASAAANNFSVAVTFTEPLKVDVTANSSGESSGNATVVNNISSWTIESPIGSSVQLSGKDISYSPSTLTATIEGVMLPPDQTFRIKALTATGVVKIQDLSGNVVDTTSSGSLATGTVQNVHTMGMLGMGQTSGEVNFFDRGMKPIRVFPRTGMAGATSMYEVEFPADTAIPSGGTVVLTFPTGFSFVGDGGSTECQDAVTTIENNDLNGPSTGTVTIASIACSNAARTVTVTTAGAATVAGDRVRFILQGIVNSPVPKDYNTGGYTADIKTRNASSVQLDSMTSMPFLLSQPGTQKVEGTVFNDDGAGAGEPNDGVMSGSEAGVANIKVCLGGMMGFTCQTTTATGAYSFTLLGNGMYNLNIPPLTSGNYVGGPFFRDIPLSAGASQTGVNFALRGSTRTIGVAISGIPVNTNLDVFAFNPSDTTGGGNIVREVTYSAATANVNVPVSDGTWEVGVGPWMPKDPSTGPSGPPVFSFMPPRPQQVVVSGAGTYTATFALQSANRTIIGKVLDGAGSAIPNAFVMARPASRTDEMSGGGVAQSQNDGTFNLAVVNGVYVINANIPGMPPSSDMEVTVQDNTGASDSNAAADVYQEGVLITNDGSGTDNLILKIAKGGRSIAGRVLDESGNAIPYAFVNAQQVNDSGSPSGPFMGAPTDASGNFTIYVSDGRWKLSGFAPGYGELPSLTVVVNGASLTGQNLQASSSDFGTLTGSVLKGGSAVAGAFVNVYGSSGGNRTVTNTSGQFSLKVKAGTYTVEGFVPGSGPLTPVTGVGVTANQTVGNIILSMSAAGTIKVTLTGSTTISDAFVDARDSSGRGNGTGANPTSGVYEIPVPAGTYNVRANNPRYGLIGYRNGVTVTAGETTTINFTPAASYIVSGVVNSASALCQSSPSVSFADKTNGRVAVTTASSTGSFSISLPNGSYYEQASKPGCIDSAAPSQITVAGANVASGVDRTLTEANATIRGRVTLSGTGVSMTTKVIAESSDHRFAFADVETAATGGENNYTLSVIPGTWSVKARSDGYESAETTVTITAGETRTSNFALSVIAGYTRYDPRASAVTPAQGGMVRDPNIGANFAINFPAGSLGSTSDSASVTTSQTTAIATTTPTSIVIGGKGIEITPASAGGQEISTLSSSDGVGVTITLPYTDADVTSAGVTEDQLSIGYWSEEKQQWDTLATTVDTTNNTLTAVTTHFSTFAPVGPRGSSSTTGGTTGGVTAGSTGNSGGRRGSGGGIVRTILNQAVKPEPQVVALEQLHAVRDFLSVMVGGSEVVFKDVPVEQWYAPYVATVLQSGIAEGYRDAQGNLKGEYGPGNPVTYAEILKMALESAGETMGVGSPDNRAARTHWAAGYVYTAEQLGISVYAGKNLNVDGSATRGSVAETLVEVLDIAQPPQEEEETGTGATVTGSGAVVTGSGATASGTVAASSEETEEVTPVTFRDVAAGSQYADAINLLASLGVVSGDTDRNGVSKGTFRPNAPINRAEVAKIFSKLIELKYIQ
ncbi:TPA: hypothetical protein DCL30_03755 [Candidatus Peribacteria bacterium]|nr:MAG: hypothetical protein A3J91_00560 [Candidatus Peribacteria bacterium RIFOXYC2_FULL_58_10]OGJ84834.1 MAG: hypothetical protein A2529_00755 [Candidatus Peribacteria bacterium RIFOXYD2_FULL_58_15]HAI98621.1 hypothetical protein [Candidatus Peribacteria bacterium]HAS34334.1 hypothetical protein [Candidatus Peribacteria bacterium]